jgi:transcriptional regulator with XRE-family HTH domain
MKDTKTSLGAKLKQARLEAELKQEQAARYLRVTPSAISTMESGQRKVDSMELFYLSKLYGKPMEWFFDEEHPLTTARGIRWYDKDPLIREIIFLMEKAAPELRRKAAYGILGFLSDR